MARKLVPGARLPFESQLAYEPNVGIDRSVRPDEQGPCRRYLQERGQRTRRPDQRTRVADVSALVDAGEPTACIVYSYSSLALAPGMLAAAEALKDGGEPPRLDATDITLTRADLAIEHSFFAEWEAAKVGASAGDSAFLGRLVQLGRPAGSRRDRPVEFARLLYRADGAQLAFELD